MKIFKNLLDPASRVSYLRTGVTSKADRLGLTSSGYPSGNNFEDIQNLLDPASRVSYLRTRVTSRVDRLGLTPSGYPSGTNFRGTLGLSRSLGTTRLLSQVSYWRQRTRSSSRGGCRSWLRERQLVDLSSNQLYLKIVMITRLCKMTDSDS